MRRTRSTRRRRCTGPDRSPRRPSPAAASSRSASAACSRPSISRRARCCGARRPRNRCRSTARPRPRSLTATGSSRSWAVTTRARSRRSTRRPARCAGAGPATALATGLRWRPSLAGPGSSSRSRRIAWSESAPSDGALLWQVPLRTSFDQNSVTPLVVNGLVISSGLETPTIAYRVSRAASGWQAQEVWRNEQVSLYMSSPAATAQAIIALSHRNRGQFVALDPATGKTPLEHAGARRRQCVHHPGRRVAAALDHQQRAHRRAGAPYEAGGGEALRGGRLADLGTSRGGRPHDCRKGRRAAHRMEGGGLNTCDVS